MSRTDYVKSIIKYVSVDEPINPNPGDMWLDKTANVVKVRTMNNQWANASGGFIGWGPGSNYGYNMGGHNGSDYISTIDRITFPFDSGTASKVGNLSGSRSYSAGCNSSNYGYCMGGYTSVYFSTIDRITFPFDSGTASAVGNLSGSRTYSTGCNSSNYGYNMGGYNGTVTSIIDRITFPFDSGIASVVGNLSGSRIYSTGCDGTDFVTLFV